jgi:hypothetical protein
MVTDLKIIPTGIHFEGGGSVYAEGIWIIVC